MNRTALVGFTGFVGSSLLRNVSFSELYNSANIEDIRGKAFELLVCAGAPGQKWWANQNPQEDWENLQRLIGCLDSVSADRSVLISTVDVYADLSAVDEGSPFFGSSAPYGENRRRLEEFFLANFPSLVVRLPALVGPGLKKNPIFDLAHHHRLNFIDARTMLQVYPMRFLWRDIKKALNPSLRTVNFVAEPLRIGDVAEKIFGISLGTLQDQPQMYDVQTMYGDLLGGGGRYMYPASVSLAEIEAYRDALRGAS